MTVPVPEIMDSMAASKLKTSSWPDDSTSPGNYGQYGGQYA
jgi:hypothetical protein